MVPLLLQEYPSEAYSNALTMANTPLRSLEDGWGGLSDGPELTP